MKENEKINVLISLPPSFFKIPRLQEVFAKVSDRANIRERSHDTAEQIQEDLSWANAVLMWGWPTLTDEMLEKAPDLKFIGHINGGQSSVRASLKRGIAVSEARHSWSPAVAEMALGLMLSGLRRISDYHDQMRRGKEMWVSDFPIDIDPLERQLTGRNVGIVGFGGIGQRLAELLAPFRTNIRIYDPYLSDSVVTKFNVNKKESVGELVEESEIIVLCAANNKDSLHLVCEKECKLFKKDSILINIGRSSLVDMPALLKRLEQNDMIAMLDVFDTEPLEADSKLRTLPNVYLTPHRGWHFRIG